MTNQTRTAGRVCPFCDIATDVPHETQTACIRALHDEISRMRGLLDCTSDGPVDAPAVPAHAERKAGE